MEAYLLRLDDACTTWDRKKWLRIAEMLEGHNVDPLVAVVPDNVDPELRQGPEDALFWNTLTDWVSRGWKVGLHGYRHALSPRPRGLLPRNLYGEWAGDSLEIQRARMKVAWETLVATGIRAEWWVAPAHNFDRTTLKALETETPIRQISDGWASEPYRRYGFTWMPQQLGRPRRMGQGIWTVCIHPNTMRVKEFQILERWLASDPPFIGWDEASALVRNYGLSHRLFGLGWRILRKMKGNAWS